MKKRNVKIILFILLLALFILGFYFLFPNFFQRFKMDKADTQVKEEEKKLKVLDLDSHTRPIAIMINNLDVARKYHVGLQDAYMVYEMIVEGGLTRMLALYKDAEIAKIGSIRSARHYYLDYVLENDAIYVHWGHSNYAKNDISKLNIDSIDGFYYGTSYFWKDKTLGIATEHTAYSSMQLILQAMDKLGYRNTTTVTPLLKYSIDPVDLSFIEEVIPANHIAIRYSSIMTTSYDYDIENMTYKRNVNGENHVDYETKEQYTAKNIITYQVPNTTITGDEKGRQDLSNLGKGEGYFITEGYAVPITWEKKSRSAKTIYRLKNGQELQVNDGNTYIQIQPVGQNLTIS